VLNVWSGAAVGTRLAVVLCISNTRPQTGFRGIWGSGLSISAAMGVRDNNEASWTQVLEVLEVCDQRAASLRVYALTTCRSAPIVSS
jgi:hypothetical protein